MNKDKMKFLLIGGDIRIKEAIKISEADRFIAWKERVNLFDGGIEKIVQKFVKENQGVRFSYSF